MDDQDIIYQAEAFRDAQSKGITFAEWADSKDFLMSDRGMIFLALCNLKRRQTNEKGGECQFN